MSEQLLSDALRCDYCGGFIDPDSYKCPYCGTQYSKPVNNLTDLFHQKTVIKSAPCEVFDIRKKVNAYDLRAMQDIGMPVETEIRKDMARQLADTLAKNLLIEADYNIDMAEITYRAKLRVVKPDYDFR